MREQRFPSFYRYRWIELLNSKQLQQLIMKKIAIVFFIFISLGAKSQVGFEQYYAEKQLLTILQQAKTNWDQLEAYGMLAMHYQHTNKDSLAKVYLSKVKEIAADGKDVKLKARSLWWDDYYEPDTIKAQRYIDWATSNNLIEDRIVGYVVLASINIHINLAVAEQNILTAKTLWEGWKKDSASKDSLKIEVFKQLAHVYIHKKDGVKTVSYLLPLQDYASQDRNLSIKESALIGLAGMYNEWRGQDKKVIEWSGKLYEFYKKLKKTNKTLFTLYVLSSQYATIGDTVKARYYAAETEKLRDSIGVYGNSMEWFYDSKYYTGLISLEEYVRLIENNFNNHYFLSPLKKASIKLGLFRNEEKFDSVKHYLDLYKKLAGDSAARKDMNYKSSLLMYYMKVKQYSLAIPLLAEARKDPDIRENLSSTMEVCKIQAEAYAGLNDYKKAYTFLDQAYKLKDSLEKLSGKEEVSLMEMQKQQELQTAAFNDEKKLQEADQAKTKFKNRVRLYGLLGGLVILIAVAGLLWRNSWQKQKANQVLQATLANLKATQAQLVQSEKMASLGELTAGIAHEIQNPLNFVNNFSEVNSELIAEMKDELVKGNIEEAKTIANDIDENEQKIIFHGKRADGIVKGMLQHSRSSSGQKELTDINALCDEYLRLAYHGLRAKDKSFNASMKTDFDESIGNINIIPQDIGRVVLNLINNAFYAVDEKKKKEPNYEPIVSVATRSVKPPLGGLGAKVEIKVSDNGNGIPQKVLDKIFQPFFTTKPTGQGTGLGLSLSYDIVKAHGGELKVETKEGEGSEFIIILNSITL
jgi:signal transduction histidine kinase